MGKLMVGDEARPSTSLDQPGATQRARTKTAGAHIVLDARALPIPLSPAERCKRYSRGECRGSFADELYLPATVTCLK